MTLRQVTRAIQWQGPNRLEVVDRQTPKPGPGDVLVRVEAVGLCSTDLELVSGDLAPTRCPVVPGHETSGRIEAVGSDVASLRVGERVAIQGIVGCGVCPPCLTGRTELCRTAYDEIGFTRDGGWADAMVVPAANAVTIPEAWAPELGALLEPFACCYGAVADESVAGRRVAVVGSGPAAIYFIVALRGLGADVIAAYLKRYEQADLARAMGATAVYLDPREEPGYDLVVDAVGSDASLSQAVGASYPGGRIILYGLRHEQATIPLRDVVVRTISIAGKSARPDVWPRAIAAIEAAPAVPTAVISLRASIWDIPGIVEAQLAGSRRDYKVVASPG